MNTQEKLALAYIENLYNAQQVEYATMNIFTRDLNKAIKIAAEPPDLSDMYNECSNLCIKARIGDNELLNYGMCMILARMEREGYITLKQRTKVTA